MSRVVLAAILSRAESDPGSTKFAEMRAWVLENSDGAASASEVEEFFRAQSESPDRRLHWFIANGCDLNSLIDKFRSLEWFDATMVLGLSQGGYIVVPSQWMTTKYGETYKTESSVAVVTQFSRLH